MKINDKSINGIFVYDDSAVFERGDMVIYYDCIYNVIADTVQGVNPENDSQNYSIYLSGYAGTFEEFKEFANGDIEKGDRLVSVYTLNQILGSYMSGFSELGVINNTVLSTGQIFLSSYFDDKRLSINSTSYYTDPLEQILVEPLINNATFAVSKDVVESILGSNSGNGSTRVILRQYTYKDEENSNSNKEILIRIQELIDPDTGVIKFRWKSIENGDYNTSSTSIWKSANVDPNITEKIDNIIAYYNAKSNALDRERLELLSAFRYKPLKVTGGNSISIPGTLDNPGNTLITISFKRQLASGMFQTETIQINLGDLRSGATVSYDVFGTSTGLVYSTGAANSINLVPGSGATIQSAYYSQSFREYSESPVYSSQTSLYKLQDPNQSLPSQVSPNASFTFYLDEARKNIPVNFDEFDAFNSDKSLKFLITCEVIYGNIDNDGYGTVLPISTYIDTYCLIGKGLYGRARVVEKLRNATRQGNNNHILADGNIGIELECGQSEGSTGPVDILTVYAVNLDIDGTTGLYNSLSEPPGLNVSYKYSGIRIKSIELVL